MYGTVARMTAKPGGEAALKELLRQFDLRKPKGALGAYVYRMDSDPNEFYLVAVFQDKETYVANAESPEQDAAYQKIRALLTADPEWHDGEMVYSSQ
jgi:quinol monooxygenase YgiN